MTIENKPDEKKVKIEITRDDLDLIGNDGCKEGSGGFDEEDKQRPSRDDGDLLG
ncbi:MAG: hypothetical protein Q7T59_01720 [Candidatus Woesebacteria bacterium]|nr:hypothetical protein [Candidatus Woesebacteria bacterium]